MLFSKAKTIWHAIHRKDYLYENSYELTVLFLKCVCKFIRNNMWCSAIRSLLCFANDDLFIGSCVSCGCTFVDGVAIKMLISSYWNGEIGNVLCTLAVIVNRGAIVHRSYMNGSHNCLEIHNMRSAPL